MPTAVLRPRQPENLYSPGLKYHHVPDQTDSNHRDKPRAGKPGAGAVGGGGTIGTRRLGTSQGPTIQDTKPETGSKAAFDFDFAKPNETKTTTTLQRPRPQNQPQHLVSQSPKLRPSRPLGTRNANRPVDSSVLDQANRQPSSRKSLPSVGWCRSRTPESRSRCRF
ncbi:hypothetical protein DRE_03397 [Drechslerella stenobrocha 248]|uniref:Uncharacterized protein n=1 Tax=Drechslerella stenobrocha 248 TaxID=1043628 RepID=W7I525_9PEZI|nr:hypothetical protein DRE_03397 [Drechslerella stenobrocha 248]